MICFSFIDYFLVHSKGTSISRLYKKLQVEKDDCMLT